MAPTTNVDPVLARLLAGYSTPAVPFDSAVHREIIVTHGKQVFRELLAKHAADLPKSLASAIGDLVDAIDAPSFYWDWTFGLVLQCLTGDMDDVEYAAAAAAYRAASRFGLSTAWKASFRTPKMLRFEDRAVHEVVGIEAVAGEGGPSLRLQHETGGWSESNGGSPLPAIPVDAERKLVLLDRHSAPECVVSHEFTSNPALAEKIREEWLEQFRSAFDILERHAPEFALWVSRLAKDIVVMTAQEGRIMSASASDAPGVLSISASGPLAIVEMLVHESSHQYLHVVNRLGDLDTGENQELYYSPAKERPRPLPRIALAFHAFANVLVAFRKIRDSDPSVFEGAANRYHKLNEDVSVMAKILRENEGLSPLGQALVEPLLATL